MHLINVKLTDREMKALETLFLENHVCDYGCVWDECQEAMYKLKTQDAQDRFCDRCPYTKAKGSLRKKFGFPEEW